jgi:hypothetical protein
VTAETNRVRVRFTDLDGNSRSVVHAITLTTDHPITEFVDEALRYVYERDDLDTNDDIRADLL